MSYLDIARRGRAQQGQRYEKNESNEIRPVVAAATVGPALSLYEINEVNEHSATTSPGELAQAEAEYEQMYWGRIIPLGDARRAAIERSDHAEAARLGAEKGALAEGEYTDARRRYLALVERPDSNPVERASL